jgi:hypothetical protein
VSDQKADPSAKPSTEELAADVARQREELAHTINDLQVQAKASAKVAGRNAAIAAGAVAAFVVVLVVIRKVRSS